MAPNYSAKAQGAAPAKAPTKEIVSQAPGDSVFLKFSQTVEQPTQSPGTTVTSTGRVVALPPAPAKVIAQEVHLKNGLTLREDCANGLLQICSGGANPTVLAQFEDTHMQLPSAQSDDFKIFNQALAQIIDHAGNMQVQDKANAAHLLPEKVAIHQRWLKDTYTIKNNGQVQGLQAHYQAAGRFFHPVYQPVAAKENTQGNLDVSQFGRLGGKQLQLFITRNHLK